MYIKPVAIVEVIEPDLLTASNEVDFTFSTEVDDDWQDSRDMWLE